MSAPSAALRDLTEWKGLRGSARTQTCHGYDYDWMVSGVQKYLRARQPAGMRWCVLELLALEQRTATSNLLNRLQVMAVEELLFADTDSFAAVFRLVNAVDSDRGQAALLLRACDVLCQARLCRVPSDVRCHYGSLGSEPLSALLAAPMPTPAVYAQLASSQLCRDVPLSSHPDDVHTLVRLFAHLLVDRESMDCFYPLFAVVGRSAEGARSTGLKLWNRRPSVYLLWSVIFLADKTRHGARHNRSLAQLLQWFHRERKEQFVFLVNAALTVLHSARVPAAAPNPAALELPPGTLADALAAHRASPRMALLPTVVDKHTHAGRAAGKDGVAFATEGAVIVGEDVEYLVPEWRAEYVALKRAQEAAPKAKRRGRTPARPAKRRASASLGARSPEREPPPQQPLSNPALRLTAAQARAQLPLLPWQQLVGDAPQFCNDGRVCGRKPACLFVWVDGRRHVLKEVMGAATQFGRSYVVMNELKRALGMPLCEPRLVLSDRRIRRADLSSCSFVGNWRLEDCSAKPAMYLLMLAAEGVPLATVAGVVAERGGAPPVPAGGVCARRASVL